MPQAPRLFINYRSEDTGPTASRLHTALTELFGKDSIFIDHATLEPGDTWPDRLRLEVLRSSLVLCLIGKRWLTAQDPETGDRRLNMPQDWVRLELETALQGKVPIIPVLVDDAEAPKQRAFQTLPTIESIATSQAIKLRRVDWEPDLAGLAGILTERGFKAIGTPPPPPDVLIEVDKLPTRPPTLFGREEELGKMEAAWDDPSTTILCVLGFAGCGKTSLLNKWLKPFLAPPNYRGAGAVLGWSFYGGAGTQGVSADAFMDSAFQWFKEASIPGTPKDKGLRLAELIQGRRTLLVLDGFEVVKDDAMTALVKALAIRNPGLCVITSREPVEELQNFGAVQELRLSRLTTEAGVHLLEGLDVHGSPQEMRAAVEEYRGHPLFLRLLGNLLTEYYHGNISERFRMSRGGIAPYEERLTPRQREFLRMLAVFRGPAPRKAMHVLRAGRLLPGLTSELASLSEVEWNAVENQLIKLELVSKGRDGDMLDTHALLRDHFASSLQDSSPDAWIEANNRLFEYYRTQAPDKPEDLASMMPLFRAVAHGCLAGRYQEAWGVEWDRIRRDEEGFSVVNLGAWSEDLVALTHFYETPSNPDRPWDTPVPQLDKLARARLLTETAFDLRGLSRLEEALPLFKEGFRTHLEGEFWWSACNTAGNLGEVLTLRGDLVGAAEFAQHSIDLAQKAFELATTEKDKTEAILTLAVNKATLAEVLHLRGKLSDGRSEYVEAEKIYIANQAPAFYQHVSIKCLHNARGFHFCDFLLDESPSNVGEVEARAAAIIIIARTTDRRPYAIGLGRLLQGQALLQRHVGGERVDLDTAEAKLMDADSILRQAGIQVYLIRVQLAMATLQFLKGDRNQALASLDEAMEATKNGQIPLLDIDALLEKTRVLLTLGKANDAQNCLDRATRQIRSTGYRRRDSLAAMLLRQCLE